MFCCLNSREHAYNSLFLLLRTKKRSSREHAYNSLFLLLRTKKRSFTQVKLFLEFFKRHLVVNNFKKSKKYLKQFFEFHF